MIASNKTFDQLLEENLSLYTAFPEQGQSIFSLNREVAIARFALSKQAEAYSLAVEILTELLYQVRDNSDKSNSLTSVMVAIQSIEQKSQSLIDSVQKVSTLLGSIVNIDVDRAALRNMLINLPSLVKETISSIAGDSQLAERISSGLDARISNMMIAFRFDSFVAPVGQQPQGIVLEQYSQMVDSVPTQVLDSSQ